MPSALQTLDAAGRRTLNLADAVDDTAPVPPPCFLNTTIWREYLKSAAKVQHSKGEQVVIMFGRDREPVFNRGFNYCEDCNTGTAGDMARAGRCDPNHLLNLPPLDQMQPAEPAEPATPQSA